MEYGYEWDRVVYDLSSVNCQPVESCPFKYHRHKLETGLGYPFHRKCPAALCKKSEAPCRGSYLWPQDDLKTLTCVGHHTDLVLNLCMELAPEGTYPDADYESEDLDETGTTYGNHSHLPCIQEHLVQEGDSCAAVGKKYGISWDQLHAWNPSLGDDCRRLDIGNSYCVAKGPRPRRSIR
jgi:hypothetical protein